MHEHVIDLIFTIYVVVSIRGVFLDVFGWKDVRFWERWKWMEFILKLLYYLFTFWDAFSNVMTCQY